MDKIKIINGNIQESSIGLESTDRHWIVENVNFVFHCAATIKFNEPLEIATEINVQGTEYLLALAAEMKYLKVITERFRTWACRITGRMGRSKSPYFRCVLWLSKSTSLNTALFTSAWCHDEFLRYDFLKFFMKKIFFPVGFFDL